MAINEVIFGGQTLMSLKGDTVTPKDLAEGVTAHDASGNLIVGTAVRGLPVGFEYLQTNPNIQAGSIPMVGGLWSRTVYADLWAWVQQQPGYLISDSEWQALAKANNGAVPFYSTGDGSTTFRVPALTVWVKGASSVEEVGDYLADSFKNHKHNVSVSLGESGSHTHNRGNMNITAQIAGYGDRTGFSELDGAFYSKQDQTRIPTVGDIVSGHSTSLKVGFDASRSWTGETSSNGAHSHTVSITEAEQGSEETRPKTVVGVYCVVAYGYVVSSGEVSLNTVQQTIENAMKIIQESNTSSYAIVGNTTDRDSNLPNYGLV